MQAAMVNRLGKHRHLSEPQIMQVTERLTDKCQKIAMEMVIAALPKPNQI